jgi:shikimate dehydrogenase
MNSIYAVAGNPIFHSKSPVMFNAALRELSLDGVYVRLAASSAEEVAATIRAIGLEGMNITSPFKTDIIPCLDEVDRDAQIIGSVNTILHRDGKLYGFNTDVDGVLGALAEAEFDPKGKSVVVLGAGGAARAAAIALLSAGAHVTITNRTDRNARQTAEKVGCDQVPLERIGKTLKGAHLVIGAVSTHDRVIDRQHIHKRLVVLDANYSKPTALVQDAVSVGARIIDGREWLLAQAVPVFERFTGRQAPIQTMRQVLMKTKRDGRTNIALIGFMGTGKTAVSEAIGTKAEMTVIDVDKRIEEKAGISIAEIFEMSGQEAFRRMEIDEIDGLRSLSNTVVSCGGGAVTKRPNVRVLRNNCLTVWLWAGVETSLARIGRTESRPLLHGQSLEQAAALLAERRFLYASACDLVINTEGKSPEEIAARIYDETYNTLHG